MTDFTPTEVEEAARALLDAWNNPPSLCDYPRFVEHVAPHVHKLSRAVTRAALATLPSPELRAAPDVRAVVEALGFEPDNHHNALKCPYCNPDGLLRAAPSAEEAGGIYVASRASVLARGEMWRGHREAGAPIVSSWIDEDGPNDTADLGKLWVRIRREVVSAGGLVLYVEPDDFPLKGAFVEIGMALAANVPISIVAPGVEIKDRNCRPFGSWIKHPLVSFADTVDEALALLSKPTVAEK